MTILQNSIARVLAVAAFSLFLTAFSASSTHAATPPDSCFAFNAGSGTITDYYSNEGDNISNPACPKDLDIPSTIGGTSVTNIAINAFYRNQLTAVTIPSSVTSIASNAFNSNEITSATITNGSATFEHNSFNLNPLAELTIGATTYQKQTPTTDSACFAITGTTVTAYYATSPIVARDSGVLCGDEVVIPGSITAIGNSSFSSKLISDVVFPSGLTLIGSYAFSGNNLESITLPASLTTIESNAFSDNLLSSVDMPLSVGSIGSLAFRGNRIESATISSASASLNHRIFEQNPMESLTIGSTTYTVDPLTTDAACFGISGTALFDYYIASPIVARDNGVLCGRDVEIPNGVTTVNAYSFYSIQLRSVIFPDSVTTINDYSFYSNRITSVSFGSGLTSIGTNAFFLNSIRSVTVPSSVTNIGVGAFASQSPWGGDIEYGTNGSPDLYAGAAVAQQVYDSSWYVQLYTEDPSNPAGLLSSAIHESSWFGDANYNGINESIGGYIVNPASATINYIGSGNSSIATAQTFTGKNGESYLNSYSIVNNLLIPAPSSDYSPTPAELTAINDAFDVYYRLGDTVTIDPPAIDGYITPEPQTFVLGAADNTFSYVYAAADSPGGGGPTSPTAPSSDPDGELADTGWDITAVYLIVIIAMVLSVIFSMLHRRAGVYRS